MSTQSIIERLEERTGSRATWRVAAVSALGPIASLAGIVWAIVQPYRVTLLHPYDQGLWWLLGEPPLFVILAGLAFHLFVARPLIGDLEDALFERAPKPLRVGD